MLNSKLAEELDGLDALALQAQINNDLDNAMKYYQQILELAPGSALSYVNLATIALLQGNYEGAITCDEFALGLKPDTPQIHNHLGIAYQKAGRTRDAIAQFELALTLTPDDPFTLCNFAGVCNEDYTTARELFHRVFKSLVKSFEEKGASEQIFFTEIQANALVCYINICLDLCDWDSVTSLFPLLELVTKDQLAEHYQPAITPSLAAILFNDQALITAITSSYAGAHCIDTGKKFTSFMAVGEKIHLAYMYDTLHSYVYDNAFISLLKKHDSKKFKISIIHTKELDAKLVQQLQKHDINLIDIQNLPFYFAASKIHEQGVQVLLDTNGYNHDAHPEILNFTPAPVQINFLGYPGSMHSPNVQFIIADQYLIPKDARRNYSEHVIELPTALAFPSLTVKKSLKRSDFGLPNNKIVFANFSVPIMLDEAIFITWLQILTNVPDSVLWLHQSSDLAKKMLLQKASAAGISATRIFFTKYEPKNAELLHQLCDIYLDTHIVNGDYNLIAALYHTKPIVSMVGNSPLSRISSSILSSADLTQAACINYDDYISSATKLATNQKIYKESVNKIKNALQKSNLFNQDEYVLKFEQAMQNLLQLGAR